MCLFPISGCSLDAGIYPPMALSFAFAYHDLNLSNRLVRLIEPLALVTYVPIPGWSSVGEC
jgi:hypothetical protein